MKKTLSLILILLTFLSCNNNKIKKIHNTGNALGTTYSIIYYDKKDVSSEFEKIFEKINKSLSTYRKDSDISKINKGEKNIIIDSLFREVFEKSKEINAKTNGYFDPTIGKIVNFYGFGPKRKSREISKKKIDSLMQYVGFEKVKLSKDDKISKTKNEIFIDFNAIAKGYTLDLIARFLDSKNIKTYLIEIGGEIVVKGDKNWKIAIDKPVENSKKREFQGTIKLKNTAMATSGNYRKFYIGKTGEKFTHIINPKTGKSSKSDILSISVFAKTCMEADAYATTFIAMGLDKTKVFLKKNKNLKAYIIYNENGENKTFISEEINNLIDK